MDGTRVRVDRRIGEGGFAFVYAVSTCEPRSRKLALKRLLAVDAEKRCQITEEITYLKNLSECQHILQIVTSANIKVGYSGTKCEEFLVLTELCRASLYDYLVTRNIPYPPLTVARIFYQVIFYIP